MANNQILASDNFASGSLAAGWSAVLVAPKSVVVANLAQPTATATLCYQVWSGLTWTNDHISEVTAAHLTAEANTQISLLARYQPGANSGYLAQFINGNVSIFRVDSGVFTSLIAAVVAPVADGDVLTFQAAGTSLTAYKNGKFFLWVNDATYTSGMPGFLQGASSAVTASQVSAWRGYSCVQQDGIWQKQGIIIPATAATIGISGSQNLFIIREDNAKILSGTVFKAWVSAGIDTSYMESTDGINWTNYASNPVIAGVGQTSFVIKVGTTYHFYGYTSLGAAIRHYTSPDGLVWTRQADALTTPGHAPAFFYVMAIIGGTWYASYVFVDSPYSFPLPTRLATSTDGTTWVDYPGNPIINNFWGFAPVNVNGIWYAWGVSANPNAQNTSKPGIDPYETVRMQSTDLINWTNPVHSVHHSQMFEALNQPNAGTYGTQVFDVNGKTYLFLQSVSSDDFILTPGFGTYQISLAIAPVPISSIVRFNEDAVQSVAIENFTSGVGNLSANWTTPTGATKLQIVAGNFCTPLTPNVRSLMGYTGETFNTSQYSEVTINTLADSGAQINPCVYVQTATNGCYLGAQGGATGALNTTAAIFKIVSGVTTQVGPAVACTPQVGDVFRLVITLGSDGFNVLSYYQNGFLLIQVQDYANSLTSGVPGISAFDATTVASAKASLWAGGNANIIPTYPGGGFAASVNTTKQTNAGPGTNTPAFYFGNSASVEMHIFPPTTDLNIPGEDPSIVGLSGVNSVGPGNSSIYARFPQISVAGTSVKFSNPA